MFENLWFQYSLVFFSSVLIVLFVTPAFIRIAQQRGIVDKPGPRRVNMKVISRFGGPAMYCGVVISILLVPRRIQEWPAIIAGGSLMMLIGAVDDMRGLPALFKLGGQILAAVIVWTLGLRMDFVTNPFDDGMLVLPVAVSFFLTVFWIIAITNTVNLIDGLDGLAAGIVCIASFTFFLVADHRGQETSALLSLAVMGATAGFLRWNFYPAKTFMGDAGAYFLGFMVAVISIGGAFKSTTAVTFLIPVLALGVPIFDTSFAIVRRVKKRAAVMSTPDKGHVHHRLLRMGLKHRDAVIFVYVTTLCLSAVSLLLIRAWWHALALFVGIALMVPFLMLLGKLKKGRRTHAKT